MLTQEPEDIGKAAARAGLSIQDTIARVSQSVQDIAQIPADYFDAIREGYRREMMLQQFTPAQQSLQPLRPDRVPVELPPMEPSQEPPMQSMLRDNIDQSLSEL